ncbi:MAG TPA: cysteine rich repeat-containing protein [Nitrospirota bacterium]|nr:cysteine rich repeat-containing protein [Nitrospirota bacterium]
MVIIRDFGRRLTLAVVVLTCVIAATSSSAQVPGPCGETIAKYCKDVIPGSGRIMKCLYDHWSDQSIACRDWIAGQQKSLEDLKSACFQEIAKLCRFDPPDDLRIFQCLDDNYVGLTLDCREKLRNVKEGFK